MCEITFMCDKTCSLYHPSVLYLVHDNYEIVRKSTEYTGQSNTDTSMEILLVSKIVSMLCLGLVTWIVGVLPLLGVRMGWLSKSETEQRHKTVVIFSCMMSFGGGVILTSCLTHMLPDVNEVLQEALENNTFPDSGLPVAEIFVLAGFLMIYLLEEVVHLILVLTGNLKPDGAGGHGHSHEHLEVPIEEGIQVFENMENNNKCINWNCIGYS